MSNTNTQSPDFKSLEQGKDTKKCYSKSEAVKQLEILAFEKQQKQYPNFPYPIKPKYSDATTNALTKCVIDYITFRGFHAERINSTGAIKDKRTSSKDVLGNIRTVGSVEWIKSTTQNGTADISATIQGRSVKIEIKCKATGDNCQSEAQKEYQRQIEKSGGVYLIVTTFEDFYSWFNHKKVKK
ncbi:TPA: hypothetical protein ACT5CJ_002357 [Flavobacterium psychrophilum]